MNTTKAIFVDRKENAAGLKTFLARQAPEFRDIQIFDKNDIISNKGIAKDVRFLFSTWNMPVLVEAEIEASFPALEAIFYAAGDTTYFSEPYERRGIRIYSARYENSIPVAEFVVAQVLLANKGYFLASDIYKRGIWGFGFRKARALSRKRPGNMASTVGIIGFGTVGALVVSMLKQFDLELLVSDPYVDEAKVNSFGARRTGLDELFETSDVISNHLPDVAATRNLLSYRYFSKMKPEATFINTGRGRQVDEKGLVRAMREQKSRSAMLDVTSHEPPFPWSPIWRTRNIFLSPHIAGGQANEVERLYQSVFKKYLEHRSGAGSST